MRFQNAKIIIVPVALVACFLLVEIIKMGRIPSVRIYEFLLSAKRSSKFEVTFPTSVIPTYGKECRVHSRDGHGQRHRNDGRWFNYSSPAMTFYAYSAIFDNRPSLLRLDRGVVRVIAITRDLSPSLRCVLHHAGGRTEVVAVDGKDGDHHVRFRGGGGGYDPYMIGCPVGSEVPLAVSLLTDPAERPNASRRACLAVDLPEKPAEKKDFAVCVSMAQYGRVNPYRVIEWMELQRLFGVTKVGVYNDKVDNATIDVLRHYHDEGFVDLRTMHNAPGVPDGVSQS